MYFRNIPIIILRGFGVQYVRHSKKSDFDTGIKTKNPLGLKANKMVDTLGLGVGGRERCWMRLLVYTSRNFSKNHFGDWNPFNMFPYYFKRMLCLLIMSAEF